MSSMTGNSIVVNSMIFKEAMKMMREEIEDNKFVKPEEKILVTDEYGIFRINSIPECEIFNGVDREINLTLNKYIISSDTELRAVLKEEAKKKTFYGAIVIIDGQPYNPLSFIYINRDIKISKETTMVTYHSSANVDENIKDNTKSVLRNLDIEDIFIEESENDKEDNEVSITAYAPRELENIGLDLHLDILHIKISENIGDKDIARLVSSRKMLLNTKVDSFEESSASKIGDNWAVEHSVIYNGSVLPTYGFWIYKDGKMHKFNTATDHPNVSENGGNYCTGINNHKSIKGISELCYGNLTSPLKQDIYHKHTLSVAKGYIEFFMEEVYEC